MSGEAGEPWTVEFFNSSGNSPVKEYAAWLQRTRDLFLDMQRAQGRARPEAEIIKVAGVEHQLSKTECGVYSLYYIWARLNGVKPSHFMDKARPIRDTLAFEFRQHLFAGSRFIGAAFDLSQFETFAACKWEEDVPKATLDKMFRDYREAAARPELSKKTGGDDSTASSSKGEAGRARAWPPAVAFALTLGGPAKIDDLRLDAQPIVEELSPDVRGRVVFDLMRHKLAVLALALRLRPTPTIALCLDSAQSAPAQRLRFLDLAVRLAELMSSQLVQGQDAAAHQRVCFVPGCRLCAHDEGQILRASSAPGASSLVAPWDKWPQTFYSFGVQQVDAKCKPRVNGLLVARLRHALLGAGRSFDAQAEAVIFESAGMPLHLVTLMGPWPL